MERIMLLYPFGLKDDLRGGAPPLQRQAEFSLEKERLWDDLIAAFPPIYRLPLDIGSQLFERVDNSSN